MVNTMDDVVSHLEQALNAMNAIDKPVVLTPSDAANLKGLYTLVGRKLDEKFSLNIPYPSFIDINE
ncbi:hypothetical protein JHU04_002085 [Brenneria sp. 4F2]|uniref:Uncharacterized protein n=1 Tax=Brenneria tiliae TaxID=2914984 RepID=A0ABT0MWR6_9GAMM|nr:hypothetical protein [Brenneria tiliae]MCG8708859.1 hypothetical protein [Brenneria bubanii]MCL2894285.1 hypothetical protein [Brenneria tiliae]